MRRKGLCSVIVLVIALVLMASSGSFGALTPADQLEKTIEYVNREDYGQAVDVLEDVLLTLREKAPLKIENIALATNVYQFGVYDERESSVFAPDEPILMYCEVRNFTFERISEESWAIRLNVAVQILDVDDNLMLDLGDVGGLERIVKTPRSSDLMLYPTTSFEGAPSGDWKLRIIVTDVPSGKKGDFVVPVSIREKRD